MEARRTGLVPQPVFGITVHDSDVLQPETARQGGLVRNDLQHTTSILGLDRLAKEKRAAVADEGSRKRPKFDDDGNEPVFKVPSLPVRNNPRQRGEETPSHPGGLNEPARKRLEEYRRNRDKQRDGITIAREQNDDAPKGLGDFQRHSNRDRDRWDSNPRSVRGSGDAPSVRVPNVGWDSTPRTSRGDNSSGWGGARNRGWDAPTPRAARGGSPEEDGPWAVDAREWEEEQVRLDRDWYTGTESGMAGDDDYNPLAQYEDLSVIKEAEIAKKQTGLFADWEANRMLTSGVATRKAVDLDFEDESESTVHVMVHDLKPPFLDGRTVYTKLLDPINPIRDPTSDMAIFSKKGSALVKEKREQAERAKAAVKLAALGGTSLGNIMGVKDEEARADGSLFFPSLTAEAEKQEKEAKENGEKESYKGDSKFASHLKASSGVSAFARNRTLKEQREYLPAFACREDLMKIIRENQVIIVVGETGSGKTTQLTQFLYEDGYCKHGIVGCTQPRRVAAMSVAKRASEEMECKLGSTVGYAIRFEDCTSSETKIKYMTDSVLLRESLNEGDLDRYSVIILDEAHERSLSTDILMGLLRKILSRRRDLKLIVTSATMNSEKFSNFYGNAPCFTIPGRTFPVEIFHAKSPCEDYVDSAVKQVLQIHLSLPPGDILVFMTGQEDIEITCQVTQERLDQLDEPAPLSVLPIYSQMPADLQAKIFDATSDGRRKVIVATNIAETSLTVDGILYIVDAGYSKLKVYNPKVGMDALQITPISQATSRSEDWRAGRTEAERLPGNEPVRNTIPEVRRTIWPIPSVLLKSLGVKIPFLECDFNGPSTPVYQLWVARFIGNADHVYLMALVPSVFLSQRETEWRGVNAAAEKSDVPRVTHRYAVNGFQISGKVRTTVRDEWAMRHLFAYRKLSAEGQGRSVRQLEISMAVSEKMELVLVGLSSKQSFAGYFHQARRVKGTANRQHVVSACLHSLRPNYVTDSDRILLCQGEEFDERGNAADTDREVLRKAEA
ncbi:P-loop containing nucleoside triphosphate hydrolase protein [Gymnopus androsaceus JB14]|uniref:P-loop containing nucleoside triphosphate hydrolase protein n=1 Tax=Gymnopus androsaceus JB14 TaxID=1447944 RepID=A0A6A4GFE6_9AGAR|nr:P-loop containing nucleoside triphosphate hydrolase protein [Gymnopus androsaceus JB14]